jgi:hypothetical protein
MYEGMRRTEESSEEGEPVTEEMGWMLRIVAILKEKRSIDTRDEK